MPSDDSGGRREASTSVDRDDGSGDGRPAGESTETDGGGAEGVVEEVTEGVEEAPDGEDGSFGAGGDAPDDAPATDDAGAPPGVSYDLDTYRALLARLIADDYEFVGFDGPIGPGEVALRHDVDLSVERAVEMAGVEASLGVTSTYCFLVTAPVYDLLAPEHRRGVERILEAGHDVGLHFDPHRYWDDRPDPADLERHVAAECESLSRAIGAEVDVVSVHVPPEWALGVDLDGVENTYAPRYFEDVEYVSDSSQKWVDGHPFADGVPRSMQLLVHPGLWHATHRPMAEVVAACRRRCDEWIDGYLAPLGE